MNRSLKLWVLPGLALVALLAALVGSWVSSRTEPEHLPPAPVADFQPPRRVQPPPAPAPPPRFQPPRPQPVVAPAPPPPAPMAAHASSVPVAPPPPALPPSMLPPPPVPQPDDARPDVDDPGGISRLRFQPHPEQKVRYGSIPPAPAVKSGVQSQ